MFCFYSCDRKWVSPYINTMAVLAYLVPQLTAPPRKKVKEADFVALEEMATITMVSICKMLAFTSEARDLEEFQFSGSTYQPVGSTTRSWTAPSSTEPAATPCAAWPSPPATLSTTPGTWCRS